jgi:hypothetical protein
MEITFESIKSLIVEEKWNNNMVTLKFKASNQQTPMDNGNDGSCNAEPG